MRCKIAILALALAGSAFARNDRTHHPTRETVFASASRPLAWCGQEARAHYAGQGITTRQGTGRHFESGNTLRADGNGAPVMCLASKGARERQPVIKIG